MATKSRRRGQTWRRAVAALALAGALIAPAYGGAAPALRGGASSEVLAGEGEQPLPAEKPPKTADKPKAPAAPALTCTLLTTEAPRGGRLEVEGAGFGKAPLVRIGGRVTRMIERTETKIAVQIHADSDGGSVTVHAGKVKVECGTLTIIGKNG